MDNKWLWVGAGGLLFVAFLATSKSEDDVSLLARMLITETGLNKSKAEMSQIVWVALNRARKRGVPMSKVVVPGIRPAWNNGDVYARRFRDASDNPKFAAAKAFVVEVLQGKHPQTIGNRTSFVHPANKIFNPPCADKRVLSGGRCLPAWVLNNPVKVGSAQFA